MIVSFFKDNTYATGIDCSYTPESPEIPQEIDEETGDIITPGVPWSPPTWSPDCIWVYVVDFDPNTQDIRLEDSGVVIENKPSPPEPYDQKRNRIIQDLITSEDYTSIDTEGITWFDIDQMILARFFKWDRGKEIGFTQRFVYLQSLSEKNLEETKELEIIKEGYLAKEAYKNYISSL
jgi:hypothetical protein